MNTNSDKTSSEDLRFDRLVDGELGEQERRELLAGLDSEAGGWRRCALAFLESQCWKQTLGDLWKGEAERSPHTPSADIEPANEIIGLPSRRSRWSSPLGTLLAMAACFLVAFWVGSRVQEMRRGQSVAPGGTTGQVASTATPRQLPIPSTRSDRSLAGVLPQAGSAAGPWRMVTVAAPAGSASAGSSFRVPAVERNSIDPQWVSSLPPAIPDDVLRAFNRTGHQVEQHRELVPVPLQDGRQLVVPVDNVRVRYVGNDNGTY